MIRRLQMTEIIKVKLKQRRKTNPTQIKKIPVKNFRIRRAQSKVEQPFQLTLNLKVGDYDPSNIVKVIFERKSFRSSHLIGAISEANGTHTFSMPFPPGIVPTVKIAVVDPVSNMYTGLSKAVAFESSDDEENEKTLLPIQGGDLGERIWKLEWSDSGPILLVNSRSEIGVKSLLKDDPIFEGAILVPALEQILLKAREGHDEGWAKNWEFWAQTNDFLEEGVSIEHLEDDDIDIILEKFSLKLNFVKRKIGSIAEREIRV
jgi:hypothetical protein